MHTPYTESTVFSLYISDSSMNSNQCITALYNQYIKNPAQADNISKLTSDAWGSDKAQCISLM